MTAALLKAFKKLAETIPSPSAVKRKSNPAKRKVAAKRAPSRTIGEPSRATGKKPPARLMSRRSKDTVPGYYPNPVPIRATGLQKYYVVIGHAHATAEEAQKSALSHANKTGITLAIIKG